MGNKRFGWHSGTLTCQDAKIRGDCYVQDDIVFSDVSAGTLGVTGGIDMGASTSAIALDMADVKCSTAAIDIQGTGLTGRAIRIGTKTTGLKISTSTFEAEPANNYLFGLFSVVSSPEATASDELRSAWIRTRVDSGSTIGTTPGWGYGVCGAEVQLKIYGANLFSWQHSALWAQLETQGTTNFKNYTYSQCVLANVGLTGTTTIDAGAVVAGVTINSNTATGVTDTGGFYGLYITDKSATNKDFQSGIFIADSVSTTGISIGLCTTGLSIPGATTTGLSVTDATTGMLLTFANSKTEGISITTASTKTLGTGMSLSGLGTYTNGILFDATTFGTVMNITGASTQALYISGNATDGIKIDSSCSGSALNITPASGKTIATGITIVQQSGGILTTAITAGGSINVTLDAPTASINGLYSLINASASSTGNLVAVRGKVIVTGTGSKVSKTALWGGIELSTVYTETGLTCAVNAQISSSSAQCPNSIVHIQSLPLSGGNFANVPYLCFSEGINAAPAGTGSNILFEVGHNAATTTPTIGTGKLFFGNTLQIAVNQTAGVRTAFYIPLSTAEASYTTAYPIVSSKAAGTNVSITNTALTVGDNYSGIRVAVTEAAANNQYGIAAYFDTTITGAQANHVYGIGSWVNFSTGFTQTSGQMICAQDNGVYMGDNTLTITGAKVIFGMRMECYLGNVGSGKHGARVCPFSINSCNSGITALFACDGSHDLGVVGGTGTDLSEMVPLLVDNYGNIRYVRIYAP